MEILEGVTSIGGEAFYGCYSLSTINIPESVTSIPENPFGGCRSLPIIDGIRYADTYLVESIDRSVSSINIKEGTRFIGGFTGNGGGFVCHQNLTSITIPNSVISIGNEAFSSDTKIQTITIPKFVNYIGDKAFANCNSLVSINVGCVNYIGQDAFINCNSLTSIYVGEVPPAVKDIYGEVSKLYGITKSACTLYVPKGCIPIYRDSECWNDFENIVEFGPATNVITYTSTDGQIVTPYNENAFGANIISNTYENGVGTITFDGDVTSIGDNAFYSCNTLESIGDLPACTSIGNYAFFDCSSLTNVGDLSACTSIGIYAFQFCSSLTNVNLSACTSIDEWTFGYCNSLTSVGDLTSCTSIGNYAFFDCSSLTSVDLSSCTSIGEWSFYSCNSLTSVGNLSACMIIGDHAFVHCISLTSVGDLSVCTSIGEGAFSSCCSLSKICIPKNHVIIAKLNPVDACTTVLVPANLLTSYKTAENWCDIANQIISMDAQTDYEISCTDRATTSDIQKTIGEGNLDNVTNLKISGTINSYDIFVMRNKMANLHHLDLTDAKIVPTENGFAYYGSYTTEEDILGKHAFYNLQKLIEVKLPKSITTIRDYAFSDCYNLHNIELPESLSEISARGFNNCYKLCRVNFPSSLKRIGENAFQSCQMLPSIHFPTNSSLEHIEREAFSGCGSLSSITLPSSVSYIGSSAFSSCYELEEIYLPTSLTFIGNNAFADCNNLNTVYASAPDPNMVQLIDDAFSTYTSATLYVPYDEDTDWHTTYDAYYWHTQWGQFKPIKPWRPVYDCFPINSDYDQDKGTIPGDEINAKFGTNAGYILGEEAEQKFATAIVKTDESQSGSIIANGNDNLHIGELYSEIEVVGKQWYFFCFPFDIKIEEISCGDAQYVFRKYDGEERAKGNSGWKNLDSNEQILKAGVGYIFQANQDGILALPVDNPNFADCESPQLVAHTANSNADASWNFVGNPYLSYYQLEDLDFDAPVTYWNGSSYEAVRAGDDDYAITPYQAFFVQKTSDSQEVGFDADKQMTSNQTQKAMTAARERRARQRINPYRLLINVTITDGENTDRTRVVYNNEKSAAYEAECDAAKFMSTESVPQLYTVMGGVQYAINERPQGEVSLGYKAVKAGTYSIAMARMDTPMLLKDLKTGETFDFTIGQAYTFNSEAGTFNDRFVLVQNSAINRIENMTVADAETPAFYNLAGQRTNGEGDAIQIMMQGENAKKVMIR